MNLGQELRHREQFANNCRMRIKDIDQELVMIKIESALVKCQIEEVVFEQFEVSKDMEPPSRGKIILDELQVQKQNSNTEPADEGTTQVLMPHQNKSYVSKLKSAMSKKISAIKKLPSPIRKSS